MLHQIIYRSHYRPMSEGSLTVLSSILSASERNNSRDRITGYLIFDKTDFMQVLEGEPGVVDAAFTRISQDPRHSDITVLYAGQTATRAFPEWAMGGTLRSPELQTIFERHGFLNTLQQSDDHHALIALTRDVAQWEQARRRTRGLSAR